MRQWFCSRHNFRENAFDRPGYHPPHRCNQGPAPKYRACPKAICHFASCRDVRKSVRFTTGTGTLESLEGVIDRDKFALYAASSRQAAWLYIIRSTEDQTTSKGIYLPPVIPKLSWGAFKARQGKRNYKRCLWETDPCLPATDLVSFRMPGSSRTISAEIRTSMPTCHPGRPSRC
jgi:hypothetical protein